MSQSKITPTFFKPTSDVGFKKLFGSSGNEALLIQLLNSIIDDKVITEVEILNPVHAVNVETTATFDLYCRCNDGARVIVEMQNVGSGRHQFPDRALAYSALSILDQWHVKQQYKFDRLYFIGIMNYSQFRDRKKAITKAQLRTEDNYVVNDKYLQIYVELPKLAKTVDESTSLAERFLCAIRDIGFCRSRPESYSDNRLDLLFEASSYTNLTNDEQTKYDKEMSTEEERQSYMELLKQEAMEEGLLEGREKGRAEGKKEGLIEGREEGREEGRKEGREEERRRLALRMLAKGFPKETVAEITSIDLTSIESLR